MQDNDGGGVAQAHSLCLPFAGLDNSEGFPSLFLLTSCRVFRGSSGAQDDQVTAEGRTEPATSGARGLLQLRFPNCIERACKKLQ